MEEARGGEGVLGIAPEGGFGEEFFYPGDGGFLERAGGVEEELDGVVLGEGCGGEGGVGESEKESVSRQREGWLQMQASSC